MLNFVLTRLIRTDKSIIGELSVMDNENVIYKCYTIENPVIGKTPNKDLAIPYGTYTLDFRHSPKYSPKFGHDMAWLYNKHVPKDRCILIHQGNYEKDTLGCILIGKTKAQDMIGNSMVACKEFYAILKQYGNKKAVNGFVIKDGVVEDSRTSNKDENI